MPKTQTETKTTTTDMMSLESMLDSAVTLAKSAGALATNLSENLATMTRVDHGKIWLGPTPTDHEARARITTTINALSDLRMTVRHSLLIGVHDEDEKAKIIRGDYC
jgi:hypothetical protein